MADIKEKMLIRFSKQGALKYIGHLDLLRVFQRVIRRAGLPAAYSQGFNPHLLLSFALPLPLGMDSVNDYAEMVLTESLPPEDIIPRLNACAPAGLRITGVRRIAENAPGIAAVTAAADYALIFPHVSEAEPAIASLLKEPTLVIPKKTKSGVRDTDIRPDIFDMYLEAEPQPQIIMRLAAGSMRFLNPKPVAEMIQRRVRPEEEPGVPAMTRLELYRHDEGFRSLYEADSP